MLSKPHHLDLLLKPLKEIMKIEDFIPQLEENFICRRGCGW